MEASWMPCVASETVSLSGHLVAWMRVRKSASCASGTTGTSKGRTAVAPFGCATAFIALLLSESKRVEKPVAATVAAAAPQKRRRSRVGTCFMTNSSATCDSNLGVLERAHIPSRMTTEHQGLAHRTFERAAPSQKVGGGDNSLRPTETGAIPLRQAPRATTGSGSTPS